MGEIKLVPEIRFPEFEAFDNDNVYKSYVFNEIFHFSTGKNIKQKEASPEFKIPCVRYGELYHMYEEVISNVINKTNLEEENLIFSDGDEILLPSAGEDPLDIGSASALLIKDVAIGRTINILKPKQKSLYSQVYVSYYINQQLKRKISSLAKGVSISNVYNSDLKKLRITLPTLPEQQKIATFLTSIDERIKLLEKKKQRLEEYKNGVMQKIFSQEIRFKDEDGNDYPDWKRKKLGQVFSGLKGKGISKDKLEVDGENKCILYGELYTTYPEVIKEVISFTNTNEGVLSKENDLLVPCSTTTSGIDLANVTALKENNILIGGDITILRSKKEVVSDFFAYYLSNHKKLELARFGQGTTIVHLYYNHFKVMNIDIPAITEQQKIASFLSSIDDGIEQVVQQIKHSKTYKKGLLQKMFV